MKLSKGEFASFGVNTRLQLLKEYGTLIKEDSYQGVTVNVYYIFNYLVEVIYDNKTNKAVKALPFTASSFFSFYN